MKFTISSNINFYKHTYEVIVPSLINSGVPNKDIYFFIGGYNHYQQIPDENEINTWIVPHNSIDFTGLVSIMELNLQSDYWFLLHDTCYVGSNFYKYIQEYNHTTDTVSLSFTLSMNMGSYKQSYLNKIKDKIIMFKNINESNIQNFKQHLVLTEDIFLTKEDHYTKEPTQCLGEEPFYNGVIRIKEYFPGTDLYKLKANWYNKPIYSVEV